MENSTPRARGCTPSKSIPADIQFSSSQPFPIVQRGKICKGAGRVPTVNENPGKSLDLKKSSGPGMSLITKVLESPGIFFCLGWQ
jgi:hypothetical protein